MVRATALILTAMLCACSKEPTPVQNAEADVDFLQNNGGSYEELCGAYTKLADAYRQAKQAVDWRNAKGEAAIYCRGADLKREFGT